MNEITIDECKKRTLWMLDQTVAKCVEKADQIKQQHPVDAERLCQLLVIINHMTSSVKLLQEPTAEGVERGFYYYSTLVDAV